MTTPSNIQPGDALWRFKSGVKHWGIYLGRRTILQIAPRKRPHIVDLEEFRSSGEVHILVSNEAARGGILIRAHEVLRNPFEYSWWRNNCQHLKNYVLTGRAYSEDINAIVAVIALLGFAAILRRA